MQAIILAAGMGKRLKTLTSNNTKCMVRVNGVPLINRMLHQLEKLQLSRIVMVVGYEGQKLVNYVSSLEIETPIVYVNNSSYEKTNNIYSLFLAKEYLRQEDTILLESDLIFEDEVLEKLLEDPRETLALVAKYESWMDGTCMKLGKGDRIEAFISGRRFRFEENKSYFKTVNIYKFSRHFSDRYYIPFLEAYIKAVGDNEYYEQVLRVIAMLDESEIRAKRLDGQLWYEIDDIQDLDIAESLFAPNAEKKNELMSRRYGGYWRYPGMLDFCYLVNPYYPPRKLMDEIKASMDCLLAGYPSGMSVNSLLAGKNFGVASDNIVVGNGAAELIKSLMGCLRGNIGAVRPGFEEWLNRYPSEQEIVFTARYPDFSYGADDLMDFYEGVDISNLLLVNPDNPTGNYIPKKEVLLLVQWAADRGIRLIVDESFSDFAEEEDNTLLQQDLLEENPHLIVVKSISKSHGVPGLRLGIAASGDREMVALMKKDVAIWNINSVAEFYLQISGKYTKEFVRSMESLREERRRFRERLGSIPGLRVLPSQANYFMMELPDGADAGDISNKLLSRHNILVKDLSRKVGRLGFLRVSVRNASDNDRLAEALQQEL